MGLFSRFFRHQIGCPHHIHPSDENLVDETDVAWFSNLTENDVRLLYQEDDVFRAAAYMKYKDKGLSEEDAARKVWKYFPYFYIDPNKRGDTPPRLADDDAKLPFLIKDKVNRLASQGTLTKDLAERFDSMNAAIRHVIRASS
jgi:hypothetical protein